MTLVEEIEINYEKLLRLSATLDGYLHESGSWGKFELDPEKADEYWKTRKIFEEEISRWMANIRKAVNSIPSSVKRSYKEQRTEYQTTGDVYTIIQYDNEEYEAIVGFLKDVVKSHNSVLSNLKKFNRIFDVFRDARGSVLSLCRSIEIFVPEVMVTIEQQIDLIFKLKEKGIEESALLIEELDQIDDNLKKCANARSALEKVVEAFCKKKGIEIKKGFYTNLDNAIKADLDKKQKRNAIGGHYSFVSRIIHKELEDNARNTQFAVNGLLNIIHSFPFVNS